MNIAIIVGIVAIIIGIILGKLIGKCPTCPVCQQKEGTSCPKCTSCPVCQQKQCPQQKECPKCQQKQCPQQKECPTCEKCPACQQKECPTCQVCQQQPVPQYQPENSSFGEKTMAPPPQRNIKMINGCDIDKAFLTCPNSIISSGDIQYGRWDMNICPDKSVNSSIPSAYKRYRLPASCIGQSNCELSNLSQILGDDPAPGIYKHYYISYQCQ